MKFEEVQFEVAPKFHDSVFPSDTEFHHCTFGRSSGKSGGSGDALAERGALRALRVAMNKAKATEAELEFFEREQRASRHLLEYRNAPTTKILSLIYDKVSGYGTAPGRALKWFFGWNFTCE